MGKPDELSQMAARIAKGEVVARPELVELASQIDLSEPEDIETWAQKLAAELAQIEDG